MSYSVSSLPLPPITVPCILGTPRWRAGLFGLLACKGLCVSGRGAVGQDQVIDSLAIVQTAVGVQSLDVQLHPQPDNVSSVDHTALVDWNPGAVGAPQLHKTARYNVTVIPETTAAPAHASTRIFQLLPVLTVAILASSKLCSFWGMGRVQVDMRWTAEFLASLALFLVSGPAVIILNKHIMREHHFKFPIVLASLGNALLVLVTRLSVGLGTFRLQGPPLGWGRYVRVVLLMNVFNFGTQVLGMWSYLFVSVPEIQILKSMTVVLVMVFATVILKEPSNMMLIYSILVIATGTCLSAVFEVTGKNQHLVDRPGAEVIGILLCVLASAFEASKTICSQILMDSVNVFDGVYLSSPAFLLLALIFVAALELRGLVRYHFTPALVGLLVLNAALTGLIVLSSFWFVKLVGALTLKVVTQARTLALILISVFFFQEECTSMQYVGYMLTLIGMGLYDRAKSQLAAAQPKQAAAQKEAQVEVQVQGTK